MPRLHHVLAFAALLACSGCTTLYSVIGTPPVTTPPATAPKATFLYTGGGGTGANGFLSSFRIDSTTGSLHELPGSPLQLGITPAILAADPTNRYLGIADISTFRIYLATVNPTLGFPAIATTANISLTQQNKPVSLTFNPTGTRLYAANAISGTVSAYNIPQTGAPALIALPGQPFPVIGTSPVQANALAFRPDGTVLYELDTRGITALSIDANGVPSVLQTIPIQYGFSLAIDPKGKYLYVADSTRLDSYGIDPATGRLTLAHSLDSGSSLYTFALSPTGDAAYVCKPGVEPGGGTGRLLQLLSYTVKDGVFAATGNMRSGVFSLQLAVDPSGAFLYAPENGQPGTVPSSQVVDQFAIGANGTIAPIANAPTANTPGQPLGVALSGVR